jgi:hypothetical protein
VHGPIMTTKNVPDFEKVHFCCEQAADDLHNHVKDYFRIENFEVALAKEEKERSAEDRKAVRIAEQSCTKIGERYEIALPWKDDDAALPNSRSMAERRLVCLERKLNRDDTLKYQYCAKMDELVVKGYAREIEPTQLVTAKRTWFLPHFAVTNPNTPGGKFSYRLDRLSPIQDENGVLRIAGRLDHAGDIAVSTRNPVILDGNPKYVELMVQHHHRKANHQGVETVINQLRERFWILKCRRTVKKQFANCFVCKRRKAKPAQPMMGQLPDVRFAHHKKPFTNTGVDFFGPFFVTVGRRTEKRYGVLFTCLTIRAIHLEIAHDLSTSSCIMAIRRMVARRGAVRRMFSDNGTNLRGADRELREAVLQLDNSEFRDVLVTELIEWHFIPPASLHMGGAWERMIGTVKRALQTVIAHQRINDEILLTVFAEVECIINNRPLTFVSDDHVDPMSITPNHLLIGASNLASSPGVFGADDNNLRRRWRISQFLTDQFWKRWLKEYVPTLVNRSKWHKNQQNLAEGDVAVINDPTLPRNLWPLGIVENVLPGLDGVVRTVDVKTTKGLIRRPAVKVCPFDRVGEMEPSLGGECGASDDEGSFYGFDV